MTAELDLSVIVPAYNEEQRLPRSMEAIIRYLDRQPWKYEIAVVDDGSADGTCDIVRSFAEDHPRIHLLSYGGNRVAGNPASGAPNDGTFTGAIIPRK